MIGRCWRRYVDFWNEREAPDALALVRITFALALIGSVLEQVLAGTVIECYASPAEGGIFPVVEPSFPLSVLHLLQPTKLSVWLLISAQLIAAVMLLVGLFTRIAAFACFVLTCSLNERMWIFAFGGDNVLATFSFLFVLAPCGAAWSLDARWRGARPDVPCWPRRLMVFQLTVIYVVTGIMKIGSTWSFLDGYKALYLALNLPGLARWPGDWAAWVFPLTQVGTFVSKWWEITFFLVPLNQFLRRRYAPGVELAPRGRRIRRLLARWDLRWPYLIVGVLFHVALTILFDLGMFSVTMVCLYPCLLKPEEARRVLTRLRHPKSSRLRNSGCEGKL